MRWLFLGAGNMASCLIGGLLAGDTDASHVGVVDPDENTCQRAEKEFGVCSATQIATLMPALFSEAGADDRALGVVIAVKPHIVETACRAISDYASDTTRGDYVPADTVYLSVAAGVRVKSMQSWLPEHAALIRCMPNTPALLGLGVTALYANENCTPDDRQKATRLLDSAGTTLWVEHESALDAVTAVSGSGPAYFFYLIEHMTAAGVALGLPHDSAETLAIETAFGAASMARLRQYSARVLRENVTSKGGTTAAALQVFDNSKTPDIIHSAMQAAHQRAVDMGDELA